MSSAAWQAISCFTWSRSSARIEAELYSHPEAGMRYLHRSSHPQLQILGAHHEIHHGLWRKRSRSFHIAAARAYVAQGAAIGNALSQAKHIRAQPASEPRLNPAVGRRSREPQSGQPGRDWVLTGALGATSGASRSAVSSRARLPLIHSFRVRREVWGTSTKRIPTRPEESCHTTSPESRTADFPPGKLN